MKRIIVAASLFLSIVPAAANADGRHYGWSKNRPCNEGYHSSSYYRPYYRPYSYNYKPYNSYSSYHSSGSFGSIWDGMYSGRLSDREVRELREDAANIRNEEARYLSDGRLSWREREDLRKDKEAFRKDLHHELNDGEYRW